MLELVLMLMVIGIVLWAINSYVPMDAKIKNILNVVVVICVIVYVLSAFGVFHHIHDVGVPQVR